MAKYQKNPAYSDIYTAILGLATLSVIATAIYVAMVSMNVYGSILTIVK